MTIMNPKHPIKGLRETHLLTQTFPYMSNLIIVGIGPNAFHAYEFVKQYNLYRVIGFAVNADYHTQTSFCNLPVFCLEDIKRKIDVEFKVFVSLIWNRLNRDRRNLFEFCEKEGLEFANLISPHAIISESAMIGRNCWIHDFAVVQNRAQVGDNVVLRQYGMIAANCIIGSHCFFGVRSVVAGGCTVGEQSFVGIGATIFDTTTIGCKCIVGACSVVKRNMPNFSKIISSSNNTIIKQYTEQEIENKLVHTLNVR